jgi:hypothetical protein
MTTEVAESTSLIRCFDAAYPPVDPPPGYAAVLGYVGGPYAENTWTLDYWQRFGQLIQFPCYVPDLDESPGDQAADAVSLCLNLGWRPERAIVADLETEVNRAWWQIFASTVLKSGFVPVAYGSLTTVLQNAASVIWCADWNNIPEVPAGQAIWGCQDAANVAFQRTQYDSSVITAQLARLGGRGPREVTGR